MEQPLVEGFCERDVTKKAVTEIRKQIYKEEEYRIELKVSFEEHYNRELGITYRAYKGNVNKGMGVIEYKKAPNLYRKEADSEINKHGVIYEEGVGDYYIRVDREEIYKRYPKLKYVKDIERAIITILREYIPVVKHLYETKYRFITRGIDKKGTYEEVSNIWYENLGEGEYKFYRYEEGYNVSMVGDEQEKGYVEGLPVGYFVSEGELFVYPKTYFEWNEYKVEKEAISEEDMDNGRGLTEYGGTPVKVEW